jgi:hypothetical protein
VAARKGRMGFRHPGTGERPRRRANRLRTGRSPSAPRVSADPGRGVSR